MMNKTDSQIEEWLKKLERESWQLELLVSAFTIFLLIGASAEYESFIVDLNYRFNLQGGLSVIMVFMALLGQSIKALTIFLIVHLLFRGFWIGTIGLRSVQTDVDFKALKYSQFFTQKLERKVVTLDRLVLKLDEICSVIFSFAFMVIFMLLALGLWFILLAGVGFLLSGLFNLFPSAYIIWGILTAIILISMILSGLIYFLDFLTLGFFKKFKWFSKVYYPFYWFYSYVTLAFLSRSIYYYMISKFSKGRIRWVLGLSTIVLLIVLLFDFDHSPYYPKSDSDFTLSSNVYDDQRASDEHIKTACIPSNFVEKPFLPLFIRYNARDNKLIQKLCPDFEPPTQEGINTSFRVKSEKGNLMITGRDFKDSDYQKMLDCHQSIYEISINDSVYTELTFHFYEHPAKNQKGLLTNIPSRGFVDGQNELVIRKRILNDTTGSFKDLIKIPFWHQTP